MLIINILYDFNRQENSYRSDGASVSEHEFNSSDNDSLDGSFYEPENSSSDNEDSGITDDLLQVDVQTQLKEEGLNDYLSWHKPKRNLGTVSSLVKRFSRLVVWLYTYLGLWESLNAISVLYHLIMFASRTMELYYHYLKTDLQFKPSTIYNCNEELDELLDWFCSFRKGRKPSDSWAIRESDLHAIRVVVKKSRKLLARERRYAAAINPRNTVSELIAAKKWPLGGLAELNDAVLSEMDWARNIAKNFSRLQDARLYKMFLELVISSLYTGDTFIVMFINIIDTFCRVTTRKSWSFKCFTLQRTAGTG